MPLDHSEFLDRQKQRHSQQQTPKKRFVVNLLLSVLFTALYIVACVALAIFLDIDKTTAVLAGLFFIIAAISAYWTQQFLKKMRFRDKERKLIREVLEGSRGARMITDSADNTIYTNHKFQLLCQDSGEQSINGLAQLFENNKDAYVLFQNLAEQARRGLTDSFELSTGEVGRESWFVVTAQPVAGWTGFVHWRVDDITRQRELDRSVREEREKLIDFTDNAPVGFFSVDENGRFIFVNATLARWLGNDIKSLLEKGRLHTYLEKPPESAQAYDVIEGGGARQVVEIKMKGPAGRTFLASVNQAVVQEDGGRIRTRGVVHDLTSERQMRQALKASEDKFQRFFDEAPVSVAIIGLDGAMQDHNTAFINLIGKPIESIEKYSLIDFVSEDSKLAVTGAIAKIEQGKRMAPMEVALLDKEGEAATVQMHARRFKQSDSIVLHFIDLTEQKNLEVQFVQSQKMQAVGQLAGGIAHDFNNLLTAIIGFSDLLLLRHKPGDSSFGDIMQIKQNSNRAANLVRQLLAFSRQQTLRPQIHDMADILTELSHLIRRLIGANIDLDVVHGSNLGLVKIDAGQMEQVLINLAVNGRDAMEEGGDLTVTTSNFVNDEPLFCGEDEMPSGEWVSIAVQDTGCGISDKNLTRILEPFFTTKDVGQGTGLGLATVYGIIRQTGGFLNIDSVVGKGTTFTIYLPRVSEEDIKEDQENAEKEEPEQKTTDLTGTARILLVEDEGAVRSFSTRALMNKGYEVLGAEHGQAALNLMEEQENKQIDLLITDVMMPDMDGPTLANHMRAESPTLKIIFISGYTEDKLKEHMGEGISFLPKPFTLKQLALKVKEALDA